MIPFSNSCIYTVILFLGTLLIAMKGAQTPAGAAGQARPRRRLDAEEARRRPAESEAPGMGINWSYPHTK
ncbi:hypothetical protein A4244_04390 [Bacillus badius]|nr:hypothetical protein A4244_04390 [Bacillus badius]OCS86304.1 hypothetical protein A6M11_04385 [Bacillus badius]